jgi:cytochrome P450
MEYIPYGGGVRRCIGAAFANMEMRVVIRTMLRSFDIHPSTARDERWRSNRVSITPSRGALVRVAPRGVSGRW